MSLAMHEAHATGLADPALRRALVDYIKRRVSPSDVDDVVQTVLVDALEAADRPPTGDPLRRWLLGVARHKVVDLHRRKGREPVADADVELPDPRLDAPVEERSLVDWAERQVGEKDDARQTLGILAREGEGEKLESIAADERLPAATVRQRVSRMRKFLRARWKEELALVAALGVLAVVVWSLVRGPELPEARRDPAVGPSAEPIRRAAELRREAGQRCDEGRWVACLRGLDDAKVLDSAGDGAPDVAALRKRAEDALRPAPAPSASSRLDDNGPAPIDTTEKREPDKKEPDKKERVRTETRTKDASPKSPPEQFAKPIAPSKVAPKAPPVSTSLPPAKFGKKSSKPSEFPPPL